MPRYADESNYDAMKIKLEFTDVEILEVNDIAHTITIKMHLGVHWVEPRLVSLDTFTSDNQNSIDIRILEYMWLPDLDIYNINSLHNEFKYDRRCRHALIFMFHRPRRGTLPFAAPR